MNILISLVLNALALIITAKIVPGIQIDGFLTAILAAIILGLINTFIKPILLFLTAPINFLTLGLFTFVVNAVMLELTAVIVPNNAFRIYNFGSAILGALVLSVVSTVLSILLKDLESAGSVKADKKGKGRSKR